MQYVGLVAGCILSILIIYYLKNLETIGCKCALNFKHDYIFYYTCFALAIGISNILFGTFKPMQLFMMIILAPYGVAAIINLIFTIQYVDEMKKINCDCSESVFRTMMYFLAIITICIWGLSLFTFIIIFFMARQLFTKKNIKKIMKQSVKNASAV
jgi:hypothetical protein